MVLYNDIYGIERFKEKERLEKERIEKRDILLEEVVSELKDIRSRLEKLESKISAQG